jgi:hypothetical protein
MDTITFILTYAGAAAIAYLITHIITAIDHPNTHNRKERT